MMYTTESTRICVPTPLASAPAPRTGLSARHGALLLNAACLMAVALHQSPASPTAQGAWAVPVASTQTGVHPHTAPAPATPLLRAQPTRQALAPQARPSTALAAQGGRRMAGGPSGAPPAPSAPLDGLGWVPLALLAGLCSVAVREWRRADPLALFASSGQKDALSALDSMFGDDPEEEKAPQKAPPPHPPPPRASPMKRSWRRSPGWT